MQAIDCLELSSKEAVSKDNPLSSAPGCFRMNEVRGFEIRHSETPLDFILGEYYGNCFCGYKNETEEPSPGIFF